MAEQAIGVVIERLILFLAEEAVSIYELRDQVESMQEKLGRIRCFLKDADGRSARNESIKNWVNEIRQVAYDIEDVVDNFLVEVESYYNRKDWKGKAKKYANKPRELVERLKISSQIEKINKKIEGITQSRKGLGIRGSDEGGDPRRESLLEMRRRDACEDREHDVVGLEEKINELVKQLVEGEGRRRVISVVGQAGLGKTVLARKVYNRAKSSFMSAAWIHVSNNKTKEVLRELCKAVLLLPGDRDKIEPQNEGEMRESIEKKLKEEKYLVVLDDVWTPEAWDGIRGAFPDGNKGSRVLITTRDGRVAERSDQNTPPYRPPLLNEEDSHKLFFRHAFPRSPYSCPRELESSAKKIVQRCGRLPLALVTLAGILSGKEQTIQAWEDFIAGHNWDLTQGNHEISGVLALSFDDLPYSLKPCLLYCCAFPRDSAIRVKRLLRLWIAEGFVQRQGSRRPEAVAGDYLAELVDRSLVQPCKRNCFGQIKSCRVHDVLGQTLLATAEEQNFFKIYSADSKCDLLKCRRLAIHCCLEQRSPPLHLARAFISFTESESPNRHDIILQNFKMLKVLDLEGVRSVKELPSEIGDLVLLRYLGLRHTSTATLPRSVKRLYNLQTLDLRTSAGVRLSQTKVSLKLKAKHVAKMTNLRHLYFGSRSRGELFNAMEVPEDFGVRRSLKELQILSYVKAGGWVKKGLCTMTNLRKLGMQVPKGYGSGSAFGAIAELSHLHSLYLQGELQDLPTDALKNLTKLTLDSSCLGDGPFSGLQKLESLKSLRLINNAYQGKRLCCLGGGFPCLEVLNLENLEHLEDMVVESRAFGKLKYMRIASCGHLDMIPQGLENVKSLQELKLIDMAARLVERVQPNTGKDWPKIMHIESIIFTTSAVEKEFDVGQLK
ncbi:putative disease resistance protein At1g50180 [Nymphaea colorata]|nr:putative disease resistance protein At1g50180 [Nymphaea colorata]